MKAKILIMVGIALFALLIVGCEQGPIGPQGNTGATGVTGTQGEVGPQGNTGSTGAQGPQGEVGPQGPQGEKGDPGTPSNISREELAMQSDYSSTSGYYKNMLSHLKSTGLIDYEGKEVKATEELFPLV